jgi:hypothetical protein
MLAFAAVVEVGTGLVLLAVPGVAVMSLLVGLVAMVNLEDVSAFWIYHNGTTIGKVLAGNP